MSTPALRRVLRRETHSPRTTAMFVAVVILVLALGYVAVELVLSLASQPALLLAPGAGVAWLVALPATGGLTVAAAVVIALVGLVFVILAITPGRLSKQELTWGERAVVVDNGVVATALARVVSDETGIARDRVTVGVGHRTIDVTVRPGSGIPLGQEEVRAAVADEVDSYRLSRPMRIRVRIDRPEEKDLDR